MLADTFPKGLAISGWQKWGGDASKECMIPDKKTYLTV